MAIETKNFVFGEDFKDKSLPDFKAHMKKTHGVGARQAKSIYNEIHGIEDKKDGEPIPTTGEHSEDSE